MFTFGKIWKLRKLGQKFQLVSGTLMDDNWDSVNLDSTRRGGHLGYLPSLCKIVKMPSVSLIYLYKF